MERSQRPSEKAGREKRQCHFFFVLQVDFGEWESRQGKKIKAKRWRGEERRTIVAGADSAAVDDGFPGEQLAFAHRSEPLDPSLFFRLDVVPGLELFYQPAGRVAGGRLRGHGRLRRGLGRDWTGALEAWMMRGDAGFSQRPDD